MTVDPARRELDNQLERIGWGLFLIMLGGLAFIPAVPGGTWLVGAGVIMLGLNLARYVNGIAISTATLGLGTLAVALGIADLTGVDLPVFPILLIIIGAGIVYRNWRQQEGREN